MPFSLALYCAAMGVAGWHAVKETLEEEEVMDFGEWHLKKYIKERETKQILK